MKHLAIAIERTATTFTARGLMLFKSLIFLDVKHLKMLWGFRPKGINTFWKELPHAPCSSSLS